MAALTHLAPEFVREGRLYWLRSPLYIVKNNGKESYYFTDEEFNKVRGRVKGEVSRAKGLGALSETQAHNSMFTKEFQRMEQMKFSNESDCILRQLMGEDVTPRSDFVFSKIDFSTIRE